MSKHKIKYLILLLTFLCLNNSLFAAKLSCKCTVMVNTSSDKTSLCNIINWNVETFNFKNIIKMNDITFQIDFEDDELIKASNYEMSGVNRFIELERYTGTMRSIFLFLENQYYFNQEFDRGEGFVAFFKCEKLEKLF